VDDHPGHEGQVGSRIFVIGQGRRFMSTSEVSYSSVSMAATVKQAKGREKRLLVHEGERMLEAPIRGWVFRLTRNPDHLFPPFFLVFGFRFMGRHGGTENGCTEKASL
jgi:hypothetical protein